MADTTYLEDRSRQYRTPWAKAAPEDKTVWTPLMAGPPGLIKIGPRYCEIGAEAGNRVTAMATVSPPGSE